MEKIGIIQFPGSNCDRDLIQAFERLFAIPLKRIWYTDRDLVHGLYGLVIPGGFSFGDYLRGGAIASLQPIISNLKQFVQKGGTVLGICNGFQILTEAHILPGVLLVNQSGRFICQEQSIKIPSGPSLLQKQHGDKSINLPIAHKEGRYYSSQAELKQLQDNQQILMEYSCSNPNGSVAQIAGICSRDGKVWGMMPHPERAIGVGFNGNWDGKLILESFLASTL